MKKIFRKANHLFLYSVTKRLLAQAVAMYIYLSLLAVTSLIVLLTVFGGSVNISINWDSWQNLLDSISNVW